MSDAQLVPVEVQLVPAAERVRTVDVEVVNLPPPKAALAVVRPPKPPDHSLALQRLTPHSVVRALDFVIYTFVKVGAKASVGMRRALNDPAVARQTAMITVYPGKGRFKLSWYPHDSDAQIVEDLAMDQLPVAVNDLKGAGF